MTTVNHYNHYTKKSKDINKNVADDEIKYEDHKDVSFHMWDMKKKQNLKQRSYYSMVLK